MIYEQNEIEFLPVNAEDAADQLMIAKWICNPEPAFPVVILGAKVML